MNCATVFVLGFALVSWTVLKTVLPPPQETPPPSPSAEQVARAVAIVTNAEGTIVFDEKAPGKRVIAVNL